MQWLVDSMMEAAASFYLSYCNFEIRYPVIMVDVYGIK